MNILVKTGLLLSLLLFFYSCSMNKESYIKDFENFISKTEKKLSSLDENDWKKTQAKFEEFCGKYYDQFQKELNTDDKIKISVLKSKFSTFTLKREARKLQENIEDALK